MASTQVILISSLPPVISIVFDVKSYITRFQSARWNQANEPFIFRWVYAWFLSPASMYRKSQGTTWAHTYTYHWFYKGSFKERFGFPNKYLKPSHHSHHSLVYYEWMNLMCFHRDTCRLKFYSLGHTWLYISLKWRRRRRKIEERSTFSDAHTVNI